MFEIYEFGIIQFPSIISLTVSVLGFDGVSVKQSVLCWSWKSYCLSNWGLMFSLESGQEVSVTCYTDASILLVDLEQHVWSSYNSCPAPLLGISSECSRGCSMHRRDVLFRSMDGSFVGLDDDRWYWSRSLITIVVAHDDRLAYCTWSLSIPLSQLHEPDLSLSDPSSFLLLWILPSCWRKRDTIIKNRRGLNSWNNWMYPS